MRPGPHIRAAAVLTLIAAALLATPAQAAKAPLAPGAERMKFRFGPVDVTPGQNANEVALSVKMPKVAGYITRFEPNLVRTDGSIPRVDVLHLHHAVWVRIGKVATGIGSLEPTFGVGEEKTIVDLPDGYGWYYQPGQAWVLNHMIHNLYPSTDRVYVEYTLDFVRADSEIGRTMKEVNTIWVDVERGRGYPVFDVLRGLGAGGLFSYPSQAVNPYASARGPRNQVTVPADGDLVYTAGHVHPGGLHTDLFLTREDRTTRLFRSEAKYWEPAGPVSWDHAMTATPEDWRVAVKQGDVLSIESVYESRRGSWYESMGIMPVAFDTGGAAGVDPFLTPVDRPGAITHGRLAENRYHGGGPTGLPDPRRLPSGKRLRSRVGIEGFVFGAADLTVNRRVPVIPIGARVTFHNRDARRDVYHTLTACRAPCNREPGVAYPLANGPVTFDSGQLGFYYGLPGLSPTAGRDTWTTPAGLARGTYTFFCRIHPFMRGAFRVAG